MNSKLILVQGMHRAGTSALTGVLTTLGTHTLHDQGGASPENPKGFFESLSVMQLNEHILASLGSSWDDFRQFRTAASNENVAYIETFLRENLSNEKINVIKDPRISRLNTYWIKASTQCNFETYSIISCRHPMEVALSLEKRNGFTIEKGLMIWCRYMLDAERGSRTTRRATVFMEDLITNWKRSIGSAFECMQVNIDIEGKSPEVDAFLDKDLRHHQTSNFSTCDPDISNLSQMIYQAFKDNRSIKSESTCIFDELYDNMELVIQKLTQTFANTK